MTENVVDAANAIVDRSIMHHTNIANDMARAAKHSALVLTIRRATARAVMNCTVGGFDVILWPFINRIFDPIFCPASL